MADKKDLAEITEYYFDEFGKIQDLCPDVRALSKKEGRALKRRLWRLFNANLITIETQELAENMIEKNEIKKSRTEYIESEKKLKPGFFKKMLSIFKRKPDIEIEYEPPLALEQGQNEEERKEEVVEDEENQ